MKDDPCFLCTLPDCDDTSPHCAVRLLERRYWNKIRNDRHDDVTAVERAASNERFHIWHQERMAQAAEGLRPYRRSGSPWKPGEVFDPNKPSQERGWHLTSAAGRKPDRASRRVARPAGGAASSASEQPREAKP